MKNPFQVWKRGNYFYYRLPGEKSFHSTGIGTKMKAIDHIYRKIGEGNRNKTSFREYAEPYFVWDICPRVQRRLDEGKSIGYTHVKKSRRWLEMYVFDDPFASLQMSAIKRADILDLRNRLKRRVGTNTVNKVISTVKTVLSEAHFRQDIIYDPGSKIGVINYQQKEKGILTKEELQKLFSEHPGPWDDLRAYSVFNVAAKTGMRCGEILALIWANINFADYVFDICRAWKNTTTTGLPKGNKKRRIPVAYSIIEPIKQLQEESIRIAEDDLVFCYDDGSRLGATWWKKSFERAMKKAMIAWQERNIKPHSLRHSLNSHLLAAGCDPIKIRAYLGWSDNIHQPSLTPVQAGYTHWQPESLRDIILAIENIFC